MDLRKKKLLRRQRQVINTQRTIHRSGLPTHRQYARLDHPRSAIRCSRVFYKFVVASAIFFGCVVLWCRHKGKGCNRLQKLVRKAEPAVGSELATLEVAAEDRTLTKLKAIMSNASHSLHNTADNL